MRWRVDNIPFFVRPFFLVISYFLGTLLYLIFLTLHWTCRIRFEGKEGLPKNQNVIYCLWHNTVFPYITVFLHHTESHIWLNHPAWYMKPIHVVSRLIGIKGLILGSTGHSGQEAATRLVDCLKKGYFTTMMPDGPYGPPKILKKGVLHIAMQSGVPIVPIRILTPHQIILKNTWEGKRFPLPFSTVHVIYEKPIWVTENNFEEAARHLTAALG